jgi:AcrR family transcriptional regulator
MLLGEGRRLFVEGGLKAMSLARLAEATGIAKTSFYAFFSSKEALLLDVLHEEAPGVQARVMARLADPAVPAREALAAFLHALLDEYATNPFLARLVAEPGALLAVARRVRLEDIERKAAWMERPLSAFFEDRIRSGEIVPRAPAVLVDLVRSVSLLALHRDRFGTSARFGAVSGELIRLIAEGLTTPEERHDD